MKNNVCLNCGASEQEKPLLTLKYQSNEFYICPQCLPVLIHKPASLADKLPGAEGFGAPAEHHHQQMLLPATHAGTRASEQSERGNLNSL